MPTKSLSRTLARDGMAATFSRLLMFDSVWLKCNLFYYEVHLHDTQISVSVSQETQTATG
jgi:hypothetical protein